MKQFTSDEIQSRFEQLPKEVQDAVTSSDLNMRAEEIAKENSLHIDQMGELVDEIGLVMMGLRRSSEFVGDIVERLSISRAEAEKIAAGVNKDIFSSIKKQLQDNESSAVAAADPTIKIEENKLRSIADLERIGGFSVETHEQGTEGAKAPVNLPGAMPLESREELVASIEGHDHVDILVDHLLTTSVGAPEVKIEKIVTAPVTSVPEIPKETPVVPPPAPKAPQKPAGPDPYREPVA